VRWRLQSSLAEFIAKSKTFFTKVFLNYTVAGKSVFEEKPTHQKKHNKYAKVNETYINTAWKVLYIIT